MERTTIIKVLNRDNGGVIYSIPEMNGLRRVFASGETKQVTFEELQKLSYLPGGMDLLRDSLVILNNPEAVKILVGNVEPEYNYTREDIIKLMKQGSLEEFLDCLDFAPDGVKDLIKNLSVSLPLNDVLKREAILDKLGFNVDNAIRIQKQSADVEQKQSQTERRVKKTSTSSSSTGRRVVTEKKN